MLRLPKTFIKWGRSLDFQGHVLFRAAASCRCRSLPHASGSHSLHSDTSVRRDAY